MKKKKQRDRRLEGKDKWKQVEWEQGREVTVLSLYLHGCIGVRIALSLEEIFLIFLGVFLGVGMCFMGLSILYPCPLYKVLVQQPRDSKVLGHRNSIPHWYQLKNEMKKSYWNFVGPQSILKRCKNKSSNLLKGKSNLTDLTTLLLMQCF